MLGTSGKSLDACVIRECDIFRTVRYSSWNLVVDCQVEVMKYATTDPPELLAHTLYDVRVHS